MLLTGADWWAFRLIFAFLCTVAAARWFATVLAARAKRH
jgi:hypothetical protein